ncbi:hypothetical protein BJV77DRAFT_1063103 [Russula vinacea]|nr:hypothetical protein BJV77DRAFT_1063103 [Russula vinacea]
MARDEDDKRSMSPLMLDDSLSSSSQLDSPRFTPIRFTSRRRRVVITTAAALSAISLIVLAYFSSSRPLLLSRKTPYSPQGQGESSETFTTLAVTFGFHLDNLRNDTKYITSWISAGWTNDVMTYGNLIYLAMLTERVPIIGPFTPSHIGGDAGNVLFSDVFDIDYLSEKLAVQVRESTPRGTNALHLQGLDISFTAGPKSLQKIPGYEHDPHAHFWSIASLLYSPGREENMIAPQPSEVHGALLPPDEHLACFDYLYYVCAHTSFEYETDMSPAWRFVVKNFRWTNHLQSIADGYLRRILNVPDDEPIPPYIAIHARRANDFIVYCNGVSKEDCFPSIATYQRRIEEIQQETRERLGIFPHTLSCSATRRIPLGGIRFVRWVGTPPTTLQKIRYPVLIDAVLQSSGIGFIGMHGSTMSLLAGRRVQDWYSGVYKDVKWGTPDADDH